MRKTGILTGVLLSSFIGFAADTSEGYVKLTANKSEKVEFTKASWSETVADPSTRDYLVTGDKIYKPCAVQDGWVKEPCRSLTFGEVGVSKGTGIFYAYYSSEFLNNGVVFANGECYTRASNISIYGPTTITSPLTAPFRFHGDGYRPRGITLAGKVVCSSDCGILAYSHKTNGFYLAFSGDVSEYYGAIVVTSEYNSVGQPWGADLIFKDNASNFGGSITVGKDTRFVSKVDMSVGTLTLRDGACMEMVAGKKLTIRSAFNIGEKPVAIKLIGAPDSEVSEVVKYELIQLPIHSDLTADDFMIEKLGTTIWSTPFLSIVPNQDGMTKTLYVTYCPKVALIKNEKNDFQATDPVGSSSVGKGDYWDDSLPVHGDAFYSITRIGNSTTYFSLPYVEDAPYVFPAQALYLGIYTILFLHAPETVVSNIFFNSTAVLGPYLKTDLTLKGRFSVTKSLETTVRDKIVIRYVGDFTGDEDSLIQIQSMSRSTGQCRGTVELNGNNIKYRGKIKITSNYDVDKIDKDVDFDNYASLIVTSASNLGGPRDEFAYDALSINRYGKLDVRESIVLDEPTRGIYAHGDGIARLHIADEKTLTVKQQLTVNGQLYKEGAGTLALGGDLRFIDAGENVTETIPEDSACRTFYVVGGKVKPLTAYALDGFDVVFSNKTSKIDVGLALDVNSQDEELRSKGICNVKSPAPFVFLDSDASKKIPVYLECTDELAANELSFGVMTVKKGCEGVFGRLELLKPRSLNSFKITLEQIEDTVADTVTLKATAKKYGFAISIR